MIIDETQLYVRVLDWQQRLWALGISHFRVDSVELVDQCNDPEAAAGVAISAFYDSADFHFEKAATLAADEQTLDERIIHEWLHVAWRDYDRSVAALFRWVPEPSKVDYEDTIEHEYEGMLDRIARMLYALHSKNC